MDTLAAVRVELVTFLFTDRGQRCCQPWSPDTAARSSFSSSGKVREEISPTTHCQPPPGKVQLRSSITSNKRQSLKSEILFTSGDIPQWLMCFFFSPLFIQRSFAEQARSPLCITSLIKFHSITPGSCSVKTTAFCCWPLSSFTSAVVGWVFCSRVLLSGSVERRVSYAFQLPLPTVFQADWGFNVVETSRHKPVCVFPGYRSLYHESLGNWQGW